MQRPIACRFFTPRSISPDFAAGEHLSWPERPLQGIICIGSTHNLGNVHRLGKDKWQTLKNKPSVATSDTLSGPEKLKLESHYLRGQILADLADGTDHVSKGSAALLKHHGTYQQDDRERRAEARVDGPAKAKFFSFMVRTAIPGGRLTSDQLLAELDLCDEVGNTTLRITTRQGLQLHGVLKTNLKQAIRPHQRSPALDAGRLRRREAQRHVLALPVQQRSRPRRDAGARRRVRRTAQTAITPPITISGSPTAKPAKASMLGAELSPIGSAMAAPCQAIDPVEPIYGHTYLAAKIQNRHRPAGRQQRRRLCQRHRPDRHLRRIGKSSATTCSSAAASASRPAPRKPSRPSPCRCATSRPIAWSI